MTNLPKPHAHVIATVFDNGEGVLIDVQTKRYYQINETALLIWRGLETGQTTTQIVANMVTEYEVNETQATASLQRLMNDLQQQALVAVA